MQTTPLILCMVGLMLLPAITEATPRETVQDTIIKKERPCQAKTVKEKLLCQSRWYNLTKKRTRCHSDAVNSSHQADCRWASLLAKQLADREKVFFF